MDEPVDRQRRSKIHRDFAKLDLGYSPSRNAITGSEASTSVLVPISNDRIPQIINIRTEDRVPEATPTGGGEYRTVEVTPEGLPSSTRISVLRGALRPRQPPIPARNLPIVSHDEHLTARRTSKSSDARAVVRSYLRMTGWQYQDDACSGHLHRRRTRTSPSPVHDAQLAVTLLLRRQVVSARRRIGSVWTPSSVPTNFKYVIDTVNGEAYVSSAQHVSGTAHLGLTTCSSAVSKAGVKAFVPAS